MDLVSIVIPVYNMGNKIKSCVESVLNQTYENIEVILVDDGSKDDSLEQCLEIKKSDSRVRVIHTENRGSGPARNEGIMNASGKYIYFPDADDYLAPNGIETVVSAMKSKQCDLLVFGYQNIGINGEIISKKEYAEFTVSGEDVRKDYSLFFDANGKYTIQGAPWNKFFDLEVIKNNNIFYPPLRRHQDEAFIARYVNVAKKIHFISDVLYTYYVNDLGRQWDKYPVDYIDAVGGLFDDRKTNILTWNEKDSEVHDLVYKEYICGIIKALELSFSPKFDFNKRQRKKWIEDKINKSRICEINIPKNLGRYQRIVLKTIKTCKHLTYCVLELKVFVEKHGMLKYLR